MMSVYICLKFLLISRYRHKHHEIDVGCEACKFLPLCPLGGARRFVNLVSGFDLSKGLGTSELAGVSSPFGFATGNGE